MKCPCGKERKGERLGAGWHEHAGRMWCPKCWGNSFVMRAVSIPVAGPIDIEWSTLREKLRACWSGATRISNWATSELRKNDVVRTAEMTKLPPQPKLYLYPGARSIAPEVDSQSVTAILHNVEGKYREARYESVWLSRVALPTFKYPAPYPVHNQGWSIEFSDGVPIVSCRLNGDRISLRLRGGDQFRRQLGAARSIESGDAIRGELSLYQVSASTGDHRPSADRSNATRLMVKMCGWFPIRKREMSGQLIVKTDPNWLLVWHGANEERIEYFACDQLKRWTAEHREKLSRISEDTKREKRIPHRQMRDIGEMRDRWCAKHRDRIDSLTHQVSASIANICERRKIAEVIYDDSCREYVSEFAWHELKSKIEYKLKNIGVTFTFASGPTVEENREALANESRQ